MARLRKPDILRVPSVYDPFSARIAVQEGFEALFVGGYSVAAARLGAPDEGVLDLSEMADQTGRIVDATGALVFADGDTGYGAQPNIRRTVHAHAKAGAAALMIEDQTWPKRCGHMAGKDVVDRNEAVARVRAAVEARDGMKADLLILARTDANAVLGFEEAMERMRAFDDAGADILFLEAPVNEKELAAFAGHFKTPTMANILHGGMTPPVPVATLESMGFSLAVYAITALGAAGAVLQHTFSSLMRDVHPEDVLGHDSLQVILTGGFKNH